MTVTCLEAYTAEEKRGALSPDLLTGSARTFSYDQDRDILTRSYSYFYYEVVPVRWLDKYTTWDVWRVEDQNQHTRLRTKRMEQTQYLGFFYRAEVGVYRSFAPGVETAFRDAGSYPTEVAALSALVSCFRYDHWFERAFARYSKVKSTLHFVAPNWQEERINFEGGK